MGKVAVVRHVDIKRTGRERPSGGPAHVARQPRVGMLLWVSEHVSCTVCIEFAEEVCRDPLRPSGLGATSCG